MYEYKISLQSNQSNTIYPLTETVLSAQPEGIQLEIFRNSEKFSPGDQRFLVDIDPNGTIISTTSPIPVIPEMQPELPGLLTPMQNDSKLPLSGDWILQKEGIYSVNDTEVRYYAAATGHYEDLGMKQISVAAGTFESTMIKALQRLISPRLYMGPMEMRLSQRGAKLPEHIGSMQKREW